MVRADDIYQVIIKKQEKKKSTRWSLQEWLETRERIRWMDLWLAFNSKDNPNEFFIGGNWQAVTWTGPSGFKVEPSGFEAYAAGYATIAGIEAHAEHFGALKRFRGQLNLRVFGLHVQNTNITLQGGYQSQTENASYIQSGGRDVTYRNAFFGADTTLYIFKYGGIEGGYHHFFKGSVAQSEAGSFSGPMWNAGFFIDFSFVRVYGRYERETPTYSLPNSTTGLTTEQRITRSAMSAGTTLFF